MHEYQAVSYKSAFGEVDKEVEKFVGMSHNSDDEVELLYDIHEDKESLDYSQAPKELVYDETGLSRQRTTGSELSKIVSAIRDDHIQDNEDYEEYKRRGEQSALILQLSQISLDKEKQSLDGEGQNEERNLEEASVAPQEVVETPKSWFIAICCCLAVFATWGANAGYGVLLDFYLNHNSFPGGTEYDYALIGGLVVFFAQVLAPVSVLLTEVFGPRAVGVLGIILQSLGYFLASVSTKLWQIFLTEGLLVGISFAMIFIPATIALPTWFGKKKSTAMGITVSGAGLGGVVFSLSLNKVIDETGDQRWALRMCGFMTLAAASFAVTFITPKGYKMIPWSKTLTKGFIKEKSKAIFDITVMNKYPMWILCLWFMIALLGYILMLFSYAPYATLRGLSNAQASHLTAIFNASQTVGRPVLGLLADTLGRNNMSLTVCLIISILLWAFWINANTFGTLTGLAVLCGFGIGIGSLMAQSMALDILGNPKKLPAAWSVLNIGVSLTQLVAEVIALALRKPLMPNPYLHTQIFAGACFFTCFVLMVINREWLVRNTFNKRLQSSTERLTEIGKIGRENNEEEAVILEQRINRYQKLTQMNLTSIIIRAFYPIRV